MRIALLALFAVGMTHDTADACSCESFEVFVPEMGATDVPTNTREFVFTDWDYSVDVSYELRDTMGTLVELGPAVTEEGYDSSVLRVPILGVLDATTTYELSRGGMLRPNPLTFTTGAGPDMTAPGAVTVNGLAVDYAPNDGSSCGQHATRYQGAPVGYESDGRLMMRIVGEGLDTIRSLLPDEYALQRLGSSACSIYLKVDPCKDYSLSIWQRDVAGNDGPATAYDFHVRGCPPIDEFARGICDSYTGPDLCSRADYNDYEESAGGDITPIPDDDGGCTTGGASPLALLGLLALRRSRAASRTRSPRA